MKKIQALSLSALLILVLGLTSCMGSQPDTSAESSAENPPIVPEATFTLEELAENNGQNGMPAYVAIDGVVYDLSAIPAWAGGKHKGNLAGNDLSQVLAEKAPHGKSVLKKLPAVGTLEP